MGSLAEDYPKEQERCRELLTMYKEIGPAAFFAKGCINQVIKEADEASASQDLPRMIKAFIAMQGCA